MKLDNRYLYIVSALLLVDDTKNRYLDLGFSMMRRAARLSSRFKPFEPLVILWLVFLSDLAERIVPPG